MEFDAEPAAGCDEEEGTGSADRAGKSRIFDLTGQLEALAQAKGRTHLSFDIYERRIVLSRPPAMGSTSGFRLANRSCFSRFGRSLPVGDELGSKSGYSEQVQPITTLPDGTIKQISPFNGTQVWTVPGRGHRPYVNHELQIGLVDHSQDGRFCSFCELRYLDSPPEKARLVYNGTTFHEIRQVPASQLEATTAQFRVVPNLFPILPLNYWATNYAMALSTNELAWREAYLSDQQGLDHLLSVAHRVAMASGCHDWNELSGAEQLSFAETFFASTHDVVIGRRHFVDGAELTTQLASSGTLTPEEHAAYLTLSVNSAERLLSTNPFARYVTIFQNWLRPAGASFEHLHKQLAAIDQLPVQYAAEQARLRQNPNLYREFGIDYAERHGLVIARNDHAVAYAGFGHRYPAIEIHSLSEQGRPWELSAGELRGLSDLVHAMHAASGATTPCNEEWHYQPPDIDLQAPVRVVLKWRISTLAGFEGATRIYLNTISPNALHERVTSALERAEGLAPYTLG